MKISLLVFNLSSNPIVRVYPIAKVLQRRVDVEILGIYFGDGIYPAYKDEFKYIKTKGTYFPKGLRDFKKIFDEISGDIVYAFKPRISTYGIGLAKKYLDRRPLLLDIEDFELAHHFEFGWLIRQLRLLKNSITGGFFDPMGLPYEYLMHRSVKFADQISVVSSYLQDLYGGGILLPHGADTNFFDPDNYLQSEARRTLGIDENKKIIIFLGYPREHKGIELLAKVTYELNQHHDVALFIVGGNKNDPYLKRLLIQYEAVIIHQESQPHEKMPFYLSAGDIVVLPQRKTIYTKAQVPGKVFEAMAMGKSIIASKVSDLPLILEDCGLNVYPGSFEELMQAIDILLRDKNLREDLGARARYRAIEHYSWDAMETTIFEKILKPWL